MQTVMSGPAAGVIGAKALCDSIGLRNAIAFDMGGTTAKAGVIYNGDVLMTGSSLIGGYATGLPIQMPMSDANKMAVPRSKRVGQTRSPIISHTGREKRVESIVESNGLRR